MRYLCVIALILFIGVAAAQEELMCSGSISLTFSPDTTRADKTVYAQVSGMASDCQGMIAWVAEQSCNANRECECELDYDGKCDCIVTAPSTTGSKTYAACIDINDDGSASLTGEKTTAKLTVRVPTCSESVSDAQAAERQGSTALAAQKYDEAAACYAKNTSTIAQCQYYYKIAADNNSAIERFGTAAEEYKKAGDCAKKYLPDQANDLYYLCAGADLYEGLARHMPDSLTYYVAASECYKSAGDTTHADFLKTYIAQLQLGKTPSFNLTKLAKNPKLAVTSIKDNETDGEQPQNGGGMGDAIIYIIIVAAAMLVLVLVLLISGKFFKKEGAPPEEGEPETWSEEGDVPPEMLEEPKQ
jgi:hypothetical protein